MATEENSVAPEQSPGQGETSGQVQSPAQEESETTADKIRNLEKHSLGISFKEVHSISHVSTTTARQSFRRKRSSCPTSTRRQKSSVVADLKVLDREYLATLNDQQFLRYMSDMETRLKRLKSENNVAKHYLEKNDSHFWSEFDASVMELQSPDEKKKNANEHRDSIDVPTSGKPKINISTRHDMVLQYLDDLQAQHGAFMKKILTERRHVKSRLEEMKNREMMILEFRESFQELLLQERSNKRTQKLPAEKFLKLMEDCLKNISHIIEKLRLRTASLKVNYKKVSMTLMQRQELGENVHPVDFDQIEIENTHFLKKIDQQSIQLIELKRMNGHAHLMLSKHKKYWQKLQNESKHLIRSIKENEKSIEELEKVIEAASVELDKAKETYLKLQNLTASYQVPDVMEYIDVKSELDEYSKKIKVWTRRNKILDISLNSSIRQMQHVTGGQFTKSWLQDNTRKSEVNDSAIWKVLKHSKISHKSTTSTEGA